MHVTSAKLLRARVLGTVCALGIILRNFFKFI